MIKLSNEVIKRLKKEEYYTKEAFIRDCKTYLKAVSSGRILYAVTHVSSSGMSRNISIKSFEGKISNGYYRNYGMMLKTLGYNLNSNTLDVKVGGCGMDMVFATNYNIIGSLEFMKFISKKKSEILAQKVNY